MEFRLLGPLEVWADGRTPALGGLRQRRVLAALLLSPNRVVPMSQLVEAAWDTDPPATAQRQVQNRIGALRAVLTRVGAFIDTDGAGYRLRVRPHELDLLVFEDLVRRGRAAGDATLLRQALGCWRGPALAELGGALLLRKAAALEEQRLAVWEECLDLEIAAGGQAVVVAELQALVAEHPLRERLVGLLMKALYGCGRQAEALAAYRALADRLVDELGVDPSPELRRLHEELLRGEAQPPSATVTARGVVPAQLPADAWGFTGRVADLARLDDLLSDGQTGRSVVISAIAGTAGVGKTALAVHWAHRVRDKFPDGQLYVNLRGFDPSGSVMSAQEALRGFLDALQVPPGPMPSTLDAQVGLYRSLLADKRLLVVLDNARDPDQVRPLLPGAPGCVVLITSRNRLTSLIAAEGAHPLTLDLLAESEARQLLTGRLGPERVAAEPDAVDEIIVRCARLPLALAIAAARAVTHPQLPLTALAAELRHSRHGLDAFAGDDAVTDVRAVLSWSYRALSPAAARLFRLLGLHPGPDLAAPAAASLAGIPADQVCPLLAELARAHLITEHAPGRYRLHDLLRAYASEQVHAVDSDAERRAALHRMLDHYLHTAHTAAVLLAPQRDPLITLDPASPGVTPVELPDFDAAMAWLRTEHAVMLAAIRHADGQDFDRHRMQLAWSLATFHSRRGDLQSWLEADTAALAASRRLGDRAMEAWFHDTLGVGYTRLRRYGEGHAHFHQALDVYREVGHDAGQGNIHQSLVFLFEQQGQYEQALVHAQAARELFRTAGTRAAQASALNAIGWCRTQLGDHRQALVVSGEALTLFEQIDDRHGAATTLDSLGYAHHQLGEHDRAASCYRRAVDLFRESGDRYHEADALTDLGDTYHAADQPVRARDAWQRALAILDQLGHPDAEAVRAKLAGLA